MSLLTEQKLSIAAADVAVYSQIKAGGITCSGAIRSSAGASSASSGVGYATGAGAAVTQITSRTQAVTINAPCGLITLVSAAGPGGTPFSFVVNNSEVAATDAIIINQRAGLDVYNQQSVVNVTNGAFTLTLNSADSTVEQPVFTFALIKAVSA